MVNVDSQTRKCYTNDTPLYVYPTFMRSGKRYYCVKHESKKYIHSCVVKFRVEDLKPIQKQLKSHTVERVFKKETSVFNKWVQDDIGILAKSAELDMKEWKVHRFVKKEEDLKEI